MRRRSDNDPMGKKPSDAGLLSRNRSTGSLKPRASTGAASAGGELRCRHEPGERRASAPGASPPQTRPSLGEPSSPASSQPSSLRPSARSNARPKAAGRPVSDRRSSGGGPEARASAPEVLVETRAEGPKPAVKLFKNLSEKVMAGNRATRAFKSQVIESGSNVMVVARFRPALPHEESEPQSIRLSDDCKTVEVGSAFTGAAATRNSGTCGSKQFTLDHVYDSRDVDGCQEAVFEGIGRGLVSSAIEGYNICMIAYGQTGSGKTYTMLGGGSTKNPELMGEDAGVLPRFLSTLGQEIERQQAKPDYRCEFIEVYNEQIRDLLAPSTSGEQRNRKVHVHPKFGVVIDDLHPCPITDIREAFELLRFGNCMRTVSATTMNNRSSRSHAIFTFYFGDAQPAESNERASCRSSQAGSRKGSLLPAKLTSRNTVTFVDLAGREDQAASQNKQQQFREMVSINTSLFHLSNVIAKLSQGTIEQGNLTDFRNSKLTLMLSQALMGNSKTTLVATASPLSRYFDDTCITLSFAQQAKRIKTQPIVNKSAKDTVRELHEEIKKLKEALNSQDDKTDVSTKLQDAEALLFGFSAKTSTEDELAARQARQGFLEQAGLALPESPTTPYLSNMNPDPSLRGLCNYYITKSKPLMVGSDNDSCNMVLQGLGILGEMASLSVNEDGVVEALLIEDEFEEAPRVLVNGAVLDSEVPTELRNGDTIIFGYAHCFRFIDPGDVSHGVDQEKLDLDITGAINQVTDEGGEQFQAVMPYLRHLQSRPGQDAAALEPLLKALNVICPLVDEANLITRDLRDDVGGFMKFQLHALTDLFHFEADIPEVVVCVLWEKSKANAFSRKSRMSMSANSAASSLAGQLHPSLGLSVGSSMASAARPPANKRASFFGSLVDSVMSSVATEPSRPKPRGSMMMHAPLAAEFGLTDQMQVQCDNGNASRLMYVWSLEKFLSRLNDMRELYEEGSGGDYSSVRRKLAAKPHLDPWKETTLANLRILEEQMEAKIEAATGKGDSDSDSDSSGSTSARARHPDKRSEPAAPPPAEEEHASSTPSLQPSPAAQDPAGVNLDPDPLQFKPMSMRYASIDHAPSSDRKPAWQVAPLRVSPTGSPGAVLGRPDAGGDRDFEELLDELVSVTDAMRSQMDRLTCEREALRGEAPSRLSSAPPKASSGGLFAAKPLSSDLNFRYDGRPAGFGGEEDRSDDARTASTGFEPVRRQEESWQSPAVQVPFMSRACVSSYRALSPGRVVTSTISSPVGVPMHVVSAPMAPQSIHRGRAPAVYSVRPTITVVSRSRSVSLKRLPRTDSDQVIKTTNGARDWRSRASSPDSRR